MLEIGDNQYTIRYGGSQVQQSDVLHIDSNNLKASFHGDLSNCPTLPDNAFDCIILTQTLQYIFKTESAIETCHRIIKPGGTILLTVPCISPVSRDAWTDKWCWMFTEKAIQNLLEKFFEKNTIQVKGHGNILVSTAFLYGMGATELRKEQLDYSDPLYQIVITAKAVKLL